MHRTVFLCGDVMPGRGVDQLLPRHCPPRLYEPHVSSALDYVALAERVNGPIPRPVSHAYVWGDLLGALAERRPEARIVNLETSVTTSDDAAPKGINYRMHPGNVPVLTAAEIDCCVLANNHVLDWGVGGLLETLEVLERAGIRTAGAGRNLAGARAPAALPLGGGVRLLVVALGARDSGIPSAWGAGPARPGVHFLSDYSEEAVERVARLVGAGRRPGDLVLASIHWGGNWGYEVPGAHRRLAHGLIERAGVDVVHGHSSHHPKAVEVHRGRPILYGCGDLLNDYEGIGGYEGYRPELALAYFVTLDAGTHRLAGLEMVPLRIRRCRLEYASADEREWLRGVLDRQCRPFGGRVVRRGEALALVPEAEGEAAAGG